MAEPSAAVATGPVSPFAVFRKRDFSLLWTAQLISTIGSALTDLAAGILIFRLTGSALSVGLMLLATALPSLVVGLIAGVFVDRLDRKRIMLASDIVRALLVLSIPLLVGVHVAFLYLIVILSSTVHQFFDPAQESVLPDIASEEELASANSLMAISQFGSTAVGFAMAGLIAWQFPIEWAFYIDGLTFLASAACVLFVRVRRMPPPEDEASVGLVLANLRDGITYLWGTPILRSTMLVGLPVFFSIGLWNVLLLPFAVRVLDATEFEYGIQEALTSVGFVVASLLMSRYADRLREGQWIVVSCVGMGLVGVLYGLASSIWIAIVLVTISGFLNAPASIARKLVLQRNTAREMRGRVFSAFFVSRDLVLVVGIAAAGLADVIDVRVLVVAASLVLMAAGFLTLLLPGLGQPAAEWRQALQRLRTAPAAAPVTVPVRAAGPADFERLVGHLAIMGRLEERERTAFLRRPTVREVPPHTMVVRRGEAAGSAFFILDGRVHAGVPGDGGDGGYRALSTMEPGDFFGEIAALTGGPRTADIVTDGATTLLEVPAAGLRNLMRDPALSQLILDKLTERLVRTNVSDLPRLAGLDQASLRALRTPQPSVERLPKTYAER